MNINVMSAYEGSIVQRNLTNLINKVKSINFKLVHTNNPSHLEYLVKNNRIDAIYSGLGYDGNYPELQLFTSIPFGPIGIYYFQFITEYGLPFLENYGQKNNMVYIPLTLLPPELAGWSNDVINSVSYFKGKNVRAYGLYGKILEKLGSNLLNITSANIPNIKNIDYIEYSNLQTDINLGLEQKFKYFYLPSFHQPSTMLYLIFNRNIWNNLKEFQREEILNMSKVVMLDNFILYDIEQRKALDKIPNKMIIFNNNFLRDMRKVWLDLAEDIGKTNPNFKIIHNKYHEYVTNYRKLANFNPLSFENNSCQSQNFIQNNMKILFFITILTLLIICIFI